MQWVTMRLEVADEYDAPDDLNVYVEHRLNGTTTWSRHLLGFPTFDEEKGAWLLIIAPKANAPLGMYDFRVDVTDTDNEYVDDVEFPSMLEVLNNVPTPPVVQIKAPF